MSDTVKHTPGPWYAIPNPEWSGAKWRIDNKSNAPWANFGEICYASTAANARLIAAAPDLLAALEAAVERQGFTNAELIAARAAIAKVKGKAQ